VQYAAFGPGRDMMEFLLEFLDGGGVPVISLVILQL